MTLLLMTTVLTRKKVTSIDCLTESQTLFRDYQTGQSTMVTLWVSDLGRRGPTCGRFMGPKGWGPYVWQLHRALCVALMSTFTDSKSVVQNE